MSMGYGFVQFYKAMEAEKALKTLQGKRLKDHCLELKRSNRATPASEGDASKNNHQSSKISHKEDSTK